MKQGGVSSVYSVAGGLWIQNILTQQHADGNTLQETQRVQEGKPMTTEQYHVEVRKQQRTCDTTYWSADTTISTCVQHRRRPDLRWSYRGTGWRRGGDAPAKTIHKIIIIHRCIYYRTGSSTLTTSSRLVIHVEIRRT